MALLKINRKGERASGDAVVDEEALQIVPLEPNQFGISSLAASRILELLAEKNQPNLFLRVGIRGGGCSGLSIHYEFVEQARPTDLTFTHNGARVVVDPKSLSILGGATLHCREYLGAKTFMLLHNPAAKQCSCGQSFAL